MTLFEKLSGLKGPITAQLRRVREARTQARLAGSTHDRVEQQLELLEFDLEEALKTLAKARAAEKAVRKASL